ncbi:MAG: hypothetical protein HLUCCA01_10250 [Bacteroidetes bacterium HLUCCA01]|nr:MAG: hypothetical protein HLUCCA01_10250 [Bacteroidetes bacterium HLUCCA01]
MYIRCILCNEYTRFSLQSKLFDALCATIVWFIRCMAGLVEQFLAERCLTGLFLVERYLAEWERFLAETVSGEGIPGRVPPARASEDFFKNTYNSIRMRIVTTQYDFPVPVQRR